MDHSHNLFLDLVLWNGLPLAVLLVGGLLWWFARQLRATRTPGQGVLLTALLAIAVHALFEYPLSYSYFLLPFGLMMGAMEAHHPVGARLAVPVWITASLAAGAIATTVLIAIDYVDIDDNHRRLRLETMGLAEASTSDDVPDARVATNWREFLVFARMSARPGMTAEQLERMRRVYLRFPQPPVLLRYAIATGLNGRPEDARQALVRLCKMHPRKRCEEGREAWIAMQQRFPELAVVSPPEPPAGR